MCARTFALLGFFFVGVLGWILLPFGAHAAMVVSLSGTALFRHVSVIWPTYTFASMTMTKSALRAGDAVGFATTIASDSGAPIFEADLSPLNGPDVTDSSVIATIPDTDPALQDYTFRLDPVAVAPSAATGTRTVSLYAYAPLSIGDATSVPIVIDNAAPIVSLAAASASSSPGTLILYLTGSADGTGSRANIIALEGDAYDSSGALLTSGPVPHTFVTANVAALNAALASSTNGSFVHALVAIDTSSLPTSQAAALVLTLVVADGAGNIATASTSVPLVPPRPKLSSVLFIPGTEASRLYYRDAQGKDHQEWEPTVSTNISFLAMNPDGTSKFRLFTKDILDVGERFSPQAALIAKEFGQNVQVYGDFEAFMNDLVASSTVEMHAWRAYPYDWRYDPAAIVNDGTLTELPDGSITRVYLENVLQRMASSSATGKVTVVAHSNGGLLAKALLNKLQQEGKTTLVDRLILVGTPQWGTPSDIGSMLHGDGQSWLGGLLLQAAPARAVIEWLPDAYDLLPSAAYFSHVANAAAVFEPGALSGAYATQYGKFVTSSRALNRFLEDDGNVHPAVVSENDLYTPATLSSALLGTATATHAVLDAWTPPAGVAVTAIAGWGQETVSGLVYTTKTVCSMLSADILPSLCPTPQRLEHAPILTQDGDDTVVSPSAVGDVGQKLYFNAKTYANVGKNITHQDLMSAVPVQQEIINLLENNRSSTSLYIGPAEPTGGTNPLIQISSHSPVHLVVSNAAGQQSGVLPLPGTDFAGVKKDIPGSAVQVLDDEEYVTVPQNGLYRVTATGYATGTATISIAAVSSAGYASTTAELADVPVAASSTISFSVSSGAPGSARVDENGDGKAEFTISTSTFSGNPNGYVRFMEAAVTAMRLAPFLERPIQAQLYLIDRSLKMQDRIREIADHYPQLLMRHSPLIDLQVDALTRWISMRAAHPRANIPRGDFFEAERERFMPQLSTIQAQALLSMLNYVKTLLP